MRAAYHRVAHRESYEVVETCMRAQIASDLHHEVAVSGNTLVPLPLAADAELLVLAGDIHVGTAAIDIYGQYPVPVLYVHGNHEAYGHDYPEILESLEKRARGTSVTFLEKRGCVLGDIRVLGACMWTDYSLNASSRKDAMEQAGSSLTDFRAIRRSENGLPLQPEDVSVYHHEAVRWLVRELATPFTGKTVVITHHAPSIRSLPSTARAHRLAPAYAAGVESLATQADVWIHGHVHASADFYLGKCRVIANPRGRPGKNRKNPSIHYENAQFNPVLTLDL
ncbi:metallophosphoesterase family protein [Paraburkholderia bengalensis]|uniref:Metallophosphoesterase family protein n=1 Tax=Paraburkholderia bengalensis TaxID=2747562 RepID=A0ABU8ILQ5_9BURK